jgi:ankyrin repeat protein
MTLAQMAAHYQAFDLLQYLMRRGANVNLTCSANPEKGCASPFVTSIIRGDIKAFNLMMDRHPDLTARFESGKELLYPTQIAIRNRNEEIALKLWETRKEFLTARDARFAVRNEMERIAVEYYRVNPADLTEEVFFDAAYAGADSVLVFALKEAEPQARFKSYLDSHSPNHGGKTAAMIAAERGHSNALSILLGAGAIVQTRDAKGRTLVHSALKSKDPQVLQIVLEVAKNNSNLRAEKLSDRRVYRLLKAGILAGQTDNFVSILKFLDRINLNTLNRKDELIELMIQKGQDKLLKKFISLGDVKLNLDKIKMMNIENPAVKAVIQEYIAL